ncbi:MAG: hypothetical protein GY714_32035 [Desulfobacterales bacterium]|nr:hypothetical protein [Desulfobacterales bacterium]
MKKIIEELREIWDSEENALRCGGTYSSHNLRKAIELGKEIENYKKHPQYEKALAHIDIITEVWRKALKNHNSNELKFIEYDVNTGLPIQDNTSS